MLLPQFPRFLVKDNERNPYFDSAIPWSSICELLAMRTFCIPTAILDANTGVLPFRFFAFSALMYRTIQLWLPDLSQGVPPLPLP